MHVVEYNVSRRDRGERSERTRGSTVGTKAFVGLQRKSGQGIANAKVAESKNSVGAERP